VPDVPFFGIDVPQADVGHVDRLSRQLGCAPTVMNRFVKLNSDITADTVRGLARGGRTPMISLEPWTWQMRSGQTWAPDYSLDALTRGVHDDALRDVARTLSSHHGRVLIRFAHEMNADWYPWGVVVNGNTPAGYVEAWKHVHDVMDHEAPNLQWVWSPLAAWWPDALPLASVYPGDAYVDYVAASGYGHGDDGDTARSTFGRWHAEVRELTDRPALLSETGAEGPGKTAWIASLVPFLHDHPDIRGFVWFNTSPETTGATGDYRIDDSRSHLEAFRRALQDLGTPCGPATISEDDMR
jgi:beta-mannanase